MADNFFFSSLEDGWFRANFEEYHLFGYVGDRDRLSDTLTRKSLGRRFIEIFAPRINIGTILNALGNFDMARVDPDKSLAREIINLVTEEESRRTLTELLARQYKQEKKHGTYFDRVSISQLGKNTLFRAPLSSLQDQLISVEGQVVHRSAVSQFSKIVDATLRASQGNWVLSDIPPHGLVEHNSKFKGKLLLLREDKGFTETFGSWLPFCTDIGWYPYVRITGFFDATKIQTDVFPSLSVSLIEYRRPKIYREMRDGITGFAQREFQGNLNYLRDWSDLVLFGYLAPLLFKGSNIQSEDADERVASVMEDFLEKVGQDLPHNLKEFYAAIPKKGIAAD